MNQVQEFANSILHGDIDHQQWLLDEAEKFIDKKIFVEVAVSFISELQRDAERYRYLRDEDNWGEDGIEDSFEELAEATMDAFDEIIDRRISNRIKSQP